MNKRHEGRFSARKLLAALSAVLLLCGAAAADVVYTTSDFSTGTGALGVIDKEGAVTPLSVPPLTSDTALFSFKDGSGNPRVAVVERNLENGDAVTVYDPADWSRPLLQEKWAGAINIYGLFASGNMLYAACNGDWVNGGGSRIVQVSMTDGIPTGKTYNYGDSGGYTAHAVKVLAVGDSVYALFSRAKGVYPYEYGPSKLVELTEDLEVRAEYDVGANATDMAAANDGNGIIVTYAGGPQAAGTAGGIDLLRAKTDPLTNPVESLSEGKDSIAGQMIMALCYVNTQSFYFIGQRYEETADGDWNPPVSTLYRWTGTMDRPEPITAVKDISSSTGYSYHVAFDGRNDRIVTLAGDKILVLKRDDTLEKEFSSVELGGGAYSLALTDGASNAKPDDESSGCNAGLSVFLAALILPLALRKARGAKNR